MPFSLSAYSGVMFAAIAASLVFWARLAKRDDKLLFLYFAALGGAFAGAKIVYLLAEGWLHFGATDMWLELATGKSILGALLGGYAAVEWAKWSVGYQGATGDWFATIVPPAVLAGRVGCLVHGCCLGQACAPSWFTLRDSQGIARWPAVPLEMAFNALAACLFFILRRKGKLTGQHFHLYLIGYGFFRFANEFERATPRILGMWSGYQVAALAVAALGVAGFERRARLTGAGPSGRLIS